MGIALIYTWYSTNTAQYYCKTRRNGTAGQGRERKTLRSTHIMMQIDYAVTGESEKTTAVPAYLRRSEDIKNFNFASPGKSKTSSKQDPRPSSSASERKWAKVSTKVSSKRDQILENKRRTHRIRSLTMRPPIVRQASLIPDDMRLSPKLPPVGSNLRRLTLFLEQAESRLVKGYSSKDIHDLLLEKQLLYSATFSELSQQVSANGGNRASEFLNRIWKLNQGLFESFIKLHNKQISEANNKVEAMRKHLDVQSKKDEHNTRKSRLPGSIHGMVMAQLANIREKRHQAELAIHQARVKDLTREKVFVPPKLMESQQAPEQEVPRPKNTNIDDFEQIERDEVIAMAYSGCAEELEKFAAQMLKGAAAKMSNKSESTESEDMTSTKAVADHWVVLPGVVAAVDHFSAIVVVNVDLRKVLTRGQRIKIGPTSMCVHASKGKFSPICVPMDRCWTGQAAKGLTVYIQSSDSQTPTGEDSDMDDDEENIDWIVVPCVVTVTKGDNAVFTSADISKLIKRGTRVRIQNTVCVVSERGPFNYECIPINSAWKEEGKRGIPLFAEATGIWGWDKAQDALDQTAIECNNAPAELSPWIKTGITVDVTKGSNHAVTHEDSTCVLLPGQIIKVGTQVLHVAPDGPFDSDGFLLDQSWEAPTETELAVQIRWHELKIIECRLHNSLRYLGLNVNSSETPAAAAHTSVAETQTNVGNDGIEREAQSELSVSPDEDLMMALMKFNQKNGTRIHQDPELQAARQIMLVSRRLKKAGTLPMELHNCVHLFIQICREKKKADSFADMLKHKHLSIPEFTKDWFLERFGLVRIANENLARFMIGLQKHAATNACARVAARSIGWIGGPEKTGTHLNLRFSELMLEIYRELMEHNMGYIADLSGIKDPIGAAAGENQDVYTKSVLTEGALARKNSAAVTPRVSVLAAWDVLRVRLKSYSAARHHFGVVKKKQGGSKKRRRGRWIDMTKNSFVSSSFRKVEEISHVSVELGGVDTQLSIQDYIDTHAQGKKEKADTRRISNLAVDLFAVLEIILDTCKAAYEKEQEKTAKAARTLFEATDKDRDGVLTLLEFKSLMRSAGARPNQHELAQFFSESMNENGRITAKSFADTVLHHCNLGDLKQIGHTSIRKIRRAAKKLRNKGGQAQDEPENADASEVVEETSTLDSVTASASTATGVLSPDDTDFLPSPDTSTATKLKFACDSCNRSFVRQKGLDWHRENECVKTAAARESESVKGENDKSTSISGGGDDEEEESESSEEEEVVYTETLIENLAAQDGQSNDDNYHHRDDDDLVDDTASDAIERHNPEPIARALLSKICRMTREQDDIINLEALWAMLSLDGESYLDITVFQKRIEQVAGFHPSNTATSALWLLLDEDRSGWLEKEEFMKFAKQVVSVLLNSEDRVGDALREDELVIGGDPALRHFPTHIDSSLLNGWDLLLVTWENHETQIRQLVIDFGGREEKINLVLLGELCLEKSDIAAAWEAYRALSAFESRIL